jgi:hypothetical protein
VRWVKRSLATAILVLAAPACAPSALGAPRQVSNNAALATAAVAPSGPIVRLGYAVSGDAPPLTFAHDPRACDLGAGRGDGGAEVAAADGGCWKATFDAGRADIREWGADPRGSSSSAPAFAAIARLPQALTVTLPAGRFRMPCEAAAAGLTMSGDISLVGASRDGSVIALDPGCQLVGGQSLFRWDRRSGVTVSGLTIDLGRPAAPRSGLFAALDFKAYAGNSQNLAVTDVAIVNGASQSFLLSFGAAGGHAMSHVSVTGSRFALAAAAHTQNQCLGLTTVNGSGRITDFTITHDVCVNSGMQIDGDHGTVSNNDISGFAFGTGIFFAFSTSPQATCHDVTATGNAIHDSPAGVDINNTAAGGMEITCPHSVISRNVLHDLGGAGIVNFGDDMLIENNTAYDNGKNGGHGAGGIGDQAGFFLNVSPAAQARNARVVLRGNVAYDDRAGTQRYGYIDNAVVEGPVSLEGNRMSGPVQGVKTNAAPGHVSVR